jgi:hypothetical protein
MFWLHAGKPQMRSQVGEYHLVQYDIHQYPQKFPRIWEVSGDIEGACSFRSKFCMLRIAMSKIESVVAMSKSFAITSLRMMFWWHLLLV